MADMVYTATFDIAQVAKDMAKLNAEAEKAEKQRNAAAKREEGRTKSNIDGINKTTSAIGKMLVGVEATRKAMGFLSGSFEEFSKLSYGGVQNMNRFDQAAVRLKQSLGQDIDSALGNGGAGSAMEKLALAYQNMQALWDGGKAAQELAIDQENAMLKAAFRIIDSAKAAYSSGMQGMDHQSADAGLTTANELYAVKVAEIQASKELKVIQDQMIWGAKLQLTLAEKIAAQKKSDAIVGSIQAATVMDAQARINRGDTREGGEDLRRAQLDQRLSQIESMDNLTPWARANLRKSARRLSESDALKEAMARDRSQQDAQYDTQAQVANAKAANARAMRQQADNLQTLGGSSAAASAQRIKAAQLEAEAERAQHAIERDRKMFELSQNKNLNPAEMELRRNLINAQRADADKATQAAMLGSIVDEVAKGRDLRGLVGKVGAGDSRYASQIMYGGNYQDKMYSGQQTLIKAVQQLPALLERIADNTAQPQMAVFGP